MQRNLFLRAAYFLVHNSYLLFISSHCNYWCVCYGSWHFCAFATSRSSWIFTVVNIFAFSLSRSLLLCAEKSLWDSSDRCAVPRFFVSSVTLVHLGFCKQIVAVWFTDKNYVQHLRMLEGSDHIFFPCRARRMDQLTTQDTFSKDNKRSLQRPAICQILIVLSDVVKYPISTSPVYCSK